jgi:hypothetical protein
MGTTFSLVSPGLLLTAVANRNVTADVSQREREREREREGGRERGREGGRERERGISRMSYVILCF